MRVFIANRHPLVLYTIDTMIKSTLESVLKRAPEGLLESSLESPLERVHRVNSFLLQEALR